MDKARLKNYGLWVSVAAFIPMLLEAMGVNILPQNYEEIVKAFLGVLVLLGLINNPTTEQKWFKDDKSQEPSKIDYKGEITNRIK